MQPSPQPERHDQPPQQVPPTVAAYLLNGLNANADVLTRTVLTLAEDGWLRIEPEDSGLPMVRIDRLPAPDQVTRFEQIALDRVVQRMGVLTRIPLSALTSDDRAVFTQWWKGFGEAVKAEADSAGLVSDAIKPFVGCVIPLVLMAAAPTLAAIFGHSGRTTAAAAFVSAVVAFAILGSTIHPELTDKGRAAVEWWRRHGGGFDGAAIADRPPPGARPSPYSPESLAAQRSAPLPPGHAWTSHGGRWRTVKVGPLDVPTWGKPGVAIGLGATGAILSIPAALVGHYAVGGGSGTLISIAPAALFTALILGTWLPANRRRAPIPTHAEFTGQVVKRWNYESGGEDNETIYCCCIDDGTSPEGWSFRIEHALYEQLRVGDTVSVAFNPRWHEVEQIQPATPVPDPGS